ncbi:DNA polymerase I [Spiroplasma platyhelix]|uniref:DNA polymerase I n=1 Tax=Spiroplasma platyhelix PALS-1 TaxID=1276218 RepID=A0A846U1Q1_9MOLU|nr:DNA polymerase I [Spiroplasma platyhelix]MBE4704069.1 DNA polymerase I [Spiroplasma platyhelix PALS-1]NKE38439.1 DNA polymerase I [Spiroplasma platyhelix PALS-1]UJB29327.1 DNA polymerase I [Spiroplasma platyhelix PALS-1]
MKKALIIDGNNLIFKAYYATAKHGASLHSLQGVPTNALYAFIRMINKFITSNNYDALFVAFDAGKNTFRTQRYDKYKATRKSAPQELLLQIDLVKQYLDLAEIPWSQETNYEADDLIGTISKNKVAKDYEINIISSDKDLFQLLDDNIKILQPQKGLSDLKVMDKNQLKVEYHLEPKQIPDLKGLMGDNSDNLPGIKGIGPKTAIKLLQKYQTLENVIANVDKLTSKESSLIKENSAIGLLTKELATIKLDTPLKKELNDCHYDIKLLDKPELQNFYKKYDMKSLIVSQKKIIEFKDSTIKVLESWDAKFNAKLNYVWTEICWDNYHRDPLLAIAIKNEFGTFYCRKNMIANSKELQTFLVDKKYQKITWDIKKTIVSIKKNFNINADGFIFDHMLASYLLYANENINLENIANILQVKNNEDLDDGEFYGRASKKHIPESETLIAQYLELKLNFLVETYPILIEKLKTNDNWELYEKIELPTVYSLITMEINGIAVDTKQLKTMTENTKITLDKLEKELNQIAQKTLNPNSPKQISQYLFEELKLANPKKGSTAYEVLITLKSAHPIIPVLLEYRKVQKLYATYLNGLEKYIFPDHKIHTIYNQVQASTGRISSTEPNMQNITIRDDEQREVRRIFIASAENLKIVSCDYSQIELRILADISGDTNLINAFLKNHDIHAETASKIFNVSLDQVTKEQRTRAKAVNFGIIYGISSFGLSQQLKISIKESQEFIDKYFVVFPKIKEYINDTIKYCQKNGYVESLFNRRRAVPEINNNNKIIREFGQRIAMNMPIQGTAADIIKLAMIKIDTAIKEKKIKANLIAQIHDELIFEIDSNDLNTEMTKINEIMSHVVKLKVPLIINGVSGNNWYDLK